MLTFYVISFLCSSVSLIKRESSETGSWKIWEAAPGKVAQLLAISTELTEVIVALLSCFWCQEYDQSVRNCVRELYGVSVTIKSLFSRSKFAATVLIFASLCFFRTLSMAKFLGNLPSSLNLQSTPSSGQVNVNFVLFEFDEFSTEIKKNQEFSNRMYEYGLTFYRTAVIIV